MNRLPLTDELRQVVRRVVWFESPEQAISDPARFLAYAMTYASFEDMQLIRLAVSDDELRDALKNAPPGIIDPRSWAYWHLKLGQFPAPPMPRRNL